MDVTLPSGATVVLRERLMANDKFAVQKAASLALDTNTGMQHSALGMINDMRNELLKLIIEKWSLDVPIPKDNALGAAILGDILDLDDYNELAEKVEPMLQKVLGVNIPNRSAPSSSS